MQYTTIAGRQVSAMSLGTVQLGMNYGIANREGKPDTAKSFSILSAAIDAGITALDTARKYGDSEEVIGAFLKNNPDAKDKFFITTKLSSDLPAGSSNSDVEKKLVQSVETSLKNLGLSKVNCLLLHNPADMTLHGSVVANTLRRIVAQGMTDTAGVSVYHPDEADLLLKDDVYQSVQLPMNIFDQRFITSGALERLHHKNIHVFVRSAFFQGLFFLDPDAITDPDLVRCAVPHIKTLRQLSDKAGMSIAQFAISFLRSLPGIKSLVLGADNPEQVIENASLFGVNPLDGELLNLAASSFKDIDYPGIMAVLSRPKQSTTSP